MKSIKYSNMRIPKIVASFSNDEAIQSYGIEFEYSHPLAEGYFNNTFLAYSLK